MKHYKDPNTNELYGYAADGSQDSYIRSGLIELSDTEFRSILEQRAAENTPEPVVDPVEKLRAFLASNPDVAELLSNNG